MKPAFPTHHTPLSRPKCLGAQRRGPMVSIWVRVHAAIARGNLRDRQRLSWPGWGMAGSFSGIQGLSMDARTDARLLRHDLPSQVACNNVANIASFARRFEGCFARSIVFHHNGRSFCIDLVKRPPTWIESRESHVPVVRLIGSRVDERFVVGNQPLLLLFIKHWLYVLPEVVPENISHAGLEMHISHPPHRSDIVVRILRKP